MTDAELKTIVREAVHEAMNDHFISWKEAGRILKVNQNTLRDWVRSGYVKARVVGTETKFLRSEVLETGHEKYSRR